MTNVTVNVGLGGYWGDGAWGANPWGQSIPMTAATGSVGSVNVVVKYAVTGLETTGSVGSVSVVAGADAPPTGLEATGQVGTLTPGVGSGVIAQFGGWGREVLGAKQVGAAVLEFLLQDKLVNLVMSAVLMYRQQD